MELLKFLRYLSVVLLLVLFATSCGHLAKDIAPNPAINKYHRMEFDVSGSDGVVNKELGIANIFLFEEEDYEKVSFKIYGIHKGTLNIFSNACGLDINTNFEGKSTFRLADLVPSPIKCAIKLTATTDPIKDREHNIVETGIVKINVIPKDNKALVLEYTRTNSISKSEFRTYSYLGQGSMQRKEGDLTSNETFLVKSTLREGGVYRINGCGFDYDGTFEKSSFTVKLKDIYNKSKLSVDDSCDFEILVIPNNEAFSHQARFSINIYSKDVIKLENLSWEIKKKFKNKIRVSGRKYVIVCSINDSYEYKKKEDKDIKCSEKYKSGRTYWIRGITGNGRKSVFAVKDNKVIWKE